MNGANGVYLVMWMAMLSTPPLISTHLPFPFPHQQHCERISHSTTLASNSTRRIVIKNNKRIQFS